MSYLGKPWHPYPTFQFRSRVCARGLRTHAKAHVSAATSANRPRAPTYLNAMVSLLVHIKHAGKVYDVHLDPDQPPMAFKEAVYQATGVPPDRMKVMIKGGMLKVCF